ncbi:TPA: hypothetical protein R4104_001533 [Enterobacter asburiae]|nr:hypothetical protein [Enterobacter asburiae]HED1589965.1 hypothetical protein [Enterobacter asburiae]HED2713914.1 hypothetical protein [Enterobacter asburiae]HED3276673.1 hypothetical protein [Enterobacter asburiae]
MTAERMKRPWSVVGAGFNDDGVYFTFDDTTIHRADVRLMEAAPDLLEALQKLVGINGNRSEPEYVQARAAISKALGEE